MDCVSLSNLTITGNNNLQVVRTLGSDLDTAANETKFCYRTAERTIELSGTVVEYEDTIRNSFGEQYSEFTGNPFIMNLSGPEVSSGYTGSLLFEAPNMKVVEYGRPISGPGILETSFTGKCSYDAGSATSIQMTITNTAAF